ncbi:hypothetical protein LARV_03704 [Longilinea arvoryzae]|uniref:Uncharacterized protein n=1 Tax=Longilinea arvoryzae TaxID=360412 RepID=A0A0K8MXD7_9CHLR|nr:hypothetical protein [Longilinea arvoryzae]GAP15909.1 hypothetical protein LARV_03704 [Longilinea arvoryzae]
MYRVNYLSENYFYMIVLAIIVGVLGLVLQFIPGFEILAFVLVAAALGGLLGGSRRFAGKELNYARRYFKIAFDWMLLTILAAYALIVLSQWLPALQGAIDFLNAHWAGLILSMMCIVLGVCALLKENAPKTE